MPTRPWLDAAKPIEQRIDLLLVAMTLEEKIGQTHQIHSVKEQDHDLLRKGLVGSIFNASGADAGNVKDQGVSAKRLNAVQRIAVEESRLGIPILFARDVIHGHRTVFPVPLGQAATWDPELVRHAAEVTAREAAADGIKWTFTPMVDVCRDPRWGRIAEGFGEDPYLASRMAEASVKGYQGDDLAKPDRIAACVKHFAAYGGAEGGRDYWETHAGEREMRDVYLPPFAAAVRAGVATVMSAFHMVDGVPCSANRHLMTEVLKQEWGFDGFVVSDWGSVTELVAHGYATDEKDAAAKALNAGVDMEMATTSYYDNIKQLLEEKKISQQQIDDAVRNILRVKYRLGLFDNPYVDIEAQKKILDPSFLDHARLVATQSTVLLKNEGNTLPLDPAKITAVAVIGPLANAPRDQLGTWCFDGRAENSVTPLKAIRDLLGDRKVNFAKGLGYSRDRNKAGFNEALAAARKSDAVFFFAGEEWILSGEGQSRGEINLPGAQSELIAELAKTGKPLIVVIMAGRPLAIGAELEESDAVLYAWHGGTMAGPALADLIFGRESPSGKLPVTFVKGSGQIPFYYYRKNTGRPATEKSWTPIDSISVENPQSSLGYRSFHLDYGFRPLLPFGYGLSYTTFTYSDLSLSSREMNMTGSIIVRAKVSNTGNRDADEIVQLYTRDRVGSLTRPVKELKGYRRIHINKGETADVEFTITPADLSFFNGKETVTEPGEFDIWVGPNSDEGLHSDFIIK